ncbi:MAG: putative Cyclin [Streblomastix strix]|uniref:Putative Cyclin n=1 Tax=Streblomastix strix TaxID=222440 RepID=A0A5J4WML8_9EUKA|nr:MAG: putative Cyclin [Streblomastix strix]
MAQYITMNDFFENPNEYKSKFGVGICRVIQRKFELEPEQISLFEDIFQIEFDDQKNKNQTVLLYVEPDIEDLDELIMIMSREIKIHPEYITMDKYFAEPHLHNNQFGVVYCYVLKEKNELGPKFTMRPENIYQVDFDELKNKNQHVMIFSDSNDNNIQALASKIGTKEKIRICIQLSEVRGLFCFRFVGIIKNESDIEQFIKPKVSEDQESINSIEKDNDNKLSSSLPPPPDSPQTPSSFHSPGTSLGRPGTGFIDHSESDSGSTSNATLSSSSKSPPPLLSPHSLYHPSDCNEFFKFLTEYTAQDGISFSKGEIVRVIKKEVDWFTFEKDGNKRRISSGKLIQCTFGEQLNRKSYENFEQQRRKALEEEQKRKALEEEQKRKARKEQKRKNQIKKDKKLQEKQTRKTLEDEQKRISLEEEQLSEEMFFKVVTHQLLNEVMKGDNDNYQCDENSPFVSERVPTIAVRQYIERAIKYMCCRRDCYLYACIYITHYLTRTGTRLCSRNFHRLFVICLSLSAKFIGDHYYRNSYYAQVAGITVAEFNSLELEFLFKIDFALLIEVESYRLFHRNFMRGIALIDLMRFIDERYHRLNGPNATVAENTPLLQMHIQNLQAPIQLTPAQTNLQSSSPPILLQQNTDQFQQTRPQLQLQTQTQQTLQQQSQLTTLNIQQKQPQSSLQQRFTDDGSAVDMLGSSGRMSRGSNISVSDRSSILGRRIQSLDSSINSNGPNTQGTNFSIVTGDIASLIEQPESVISSLAYQYSSPTSQPDIFTQTVQNPSTIILEPAVYKEMLQKQQEKEKEKERGRKERDREEEKENRRNQTGRHSYDGRMSASATSEKSSTSSFTSPTTSSFHSHGTSLGRSGTGFIDNSEPDSGSTSKATIQYSSKSPPPLLSPHSLQNSSDCNEFFKFLSEYSAQDGISFSKGEIVRVIKKEVDWFTFEKDV